MTSGSYQLRGFDSFHLASFAQTLRGLEGADDVAFSSFEDRLNRAAKAREVSASNPCGTDRIRRRILALPGLPTYLEGRMRRPQHRRSHETEGGPHDETPS